MSAVVNPSTTSGHNLKTKPFVANFCCRMGMKDSMAWLILRLWLWASGNGGWHMDNTNHETSVLTLWKRTDHQPNLLNELEVRGLNKSFNKFNERLDESFRRNIEKLIICTLSKFVPYVISIRSFKEDSPSSIKRTVGRELSSTVPLVQNES